MSVRFYNSVVLFLEMSVLVLAAAPTDLLTIAPSVAPSMAPTEVPSAAPTTFAPTNNGDTYAPSNAPTTFGPSSAPSVAPSNVPTAVPSAAPTTFAPTTGTPSTAPSWTPTVVPTEVPSAAPTTFGPTNFGDTYAPSNAPTTFGPSSAPSWAPSNAPTPPTRRPTRSPTTTVPTSAPTGLPPTLPPTIKTAFGTDPWSSSSSLDVVGLVVALTATAAALAAAGALAYYIVKFKCRQESDKVNDVEAAKIKLNNLFSDLDESIRFSRQMPTHLTKNDEFECIIQIKSEEDEAALKSKTTEDSEDRQIAYNKLEAAKAAADIAVEAAKEALSAAQQTAYKEFKARDANGNQQFKTRAIDGDLNPQFDERFVFDTNAAQRTADAPQAATLVLEVWDENHISDDMMGQYSVKLSELDTGENQTFQLTSGGGGGELGAIVLSITLEDTLAEEAAEAEGAEAEGAEAKEWFRWEKLEKQVGVLGVTIVSCSNLKNLEVMSTSDPYVVATLRKPRVKTPSFRELKEAKDKGAEAEAPGEHLAKAVEQFEKGLLTQEEFAIAKKTALAADAAEVNKAETPAEEKPKERRESMAEGEVAAAQRALGAAEAKQAALTNQLENETEKVAAGPAVQKPTIGSPIRQWNRAKMRAPLTLKKADLKRTKSSDWDRAHGIHDY